MVQSSTCNNLGIGKMQKTLRNKGGESYIIYMFRLAMSIAHQ